MSRCIATNTDTAEESNCELSGSTDGESGDVGSADGFSLTPTRGGVTSTSREDREDEASHQPTLSEGGSQGKRPDPTVVVAPTHNF